MSITKTKYLIKCLLGRAVYLKPQSKVPHKLMGNPDAGFSVCLERLSDQPIVYAFGVGEDISFDLDMAKIKNCHVYAFDPTPKAIDFIQRQNTPSNFTFSPLAISDKEQDLEFYLPKNPNFVSGSLERTSNTSENSIVVPAKKLKSIMKELGHDKIDVLKMDIEGSEFFVISDILSDNIICKQICLEVHDRFLEDGRSKLMSMIKSLNDAGYSMFSVSDNGEELSFIKE